MMGGCHVSGALRPRIARQVEQLDTALSKLLRHCGVRPDSDKESDKESDRMLQNPIESCRTHGLSQMDPHPNARIVS